MRFSLLFAAGLAFSSFSAQAAVVGFWDFNGNLNRTAGESGVLATEWTPLGVEFSGYGQGTSVNLPGGYSAGDALGFYSLATIEETTLITVSGLNLTGLSVPTVSFAARNDGLFAFGDEFYLEFNIGSGWVRAETFSDPGDSFGLVSYTFSAGVLDNVGSASIRLAHHTSVSALNLFEVDNLQITAVPEPAGYAAALVVMLVVLTAWRRRRASQGTV